MQSIDVSEFQDLMRPLARELRLGVGDGFGVGDDLSERTPFRRHDPLLAISDEGAGHGAVGEAPLPLGLELRLWG